MEKERLNIQYVTADTLKPRDRNPRKWSQTAIDELKRNLNQYGLIEPLVVSSAPGRENQLIGGHFRLKIAKELGINEVPVVYLNLSAEKEEELALRLNKNIGEWDWGLLAEFDEVSLSDAGFTSEEIDTVFAVDEIPEEFDLEKELKKLDITKIELQRGDLYQLGDNRILCGDSTVEADVLMLMGSEKADMCFTDPPYILNYLKGGKRRGKPTEGFGYKRDRKYLETDELPDNFTELWMSNVAKIAKPDFSIIVYENWKNLRTIWGEMEKYWRVKNMLVWHLPNRHQGFSAKYKFFSKHDIAMVGGSGTVAYNHDEEPDGLQEEYETALYAISGKPHWEGYQKGKKNQPTDFISYIASDEKSSGQGVVFGTKPLEILIPYIKMLTKRGDLIIEPFCGSGSTLCAATKLQRRCYVIEKSPVYMTVAIKRWERLTGRKARKI